MRRRNKNKKTKNIQKRIKLVKQKSKQLLVKKYNRDLEREETKKEQPKNRVKQELERSDVIRAMALYISDRIKRYESIRPHNYGVTCFPGPRLFNSTETVTDLPSVPEIQAFIQQIFDKRRLQVESGIIALVLMNRTRMKINSLNWMRLILIALLLANKQSEDVYSVWNTKFVGLIPNLVNFEINVLELEFLQRINYRLHIETNTYNQYYTKLQNLLPMDEDEAEDQDQDEDQDQEIPEDHPQDQLPEVIKSCQVSEKKEDYPLSKKGKSDQKDLQDLTKAIQDVVFSGLEECNREGEGSPPLLWQNNDHFAPEDSIA